MMSSHECYIGILHVCDNSEMATVQDVKEHIEEGNRFNVYAESMDLPIRRPVWSMKEYADWRRSTDLKRFKFCPECGKPIDWRKIKEADDNG